MDPERATLRRSASSSSSLMRSSLSWSSEAAIERANDIAEAPEFERVIDGAIEAARTVDAEEAEELDARDDGREMLSGSITSSTGAGVEVR